MAGQSSAMFGWSWTDMSVFGSLVFGQALMESCGGSVYHKYIYCIGYSAMCSLDCAVHSVQCVICNPVCCGSV